MEKLCPLVKDKCIEDSCAWYVIGLNGCAANVLAQSIDSLVNIVEEFEETENAN